MTLVKLIDSPSDPVRLAFVHVFKKRPALKRDDGTAGVDKFEITPIIKPGGDNEKRLAAAIVETAKEKYGEKMVKDEDSNEMPNYKLVLKQLDEDRRGLRKGNLKKTPGGEIYDGFEGNMYVTARTTKRPTVVDRDRTPLTEEDGRPYSGCYGTVHLDIWALAKKGVKPCIVSDLTGVQFTRDGDAFGAGAPPSKPDDFEALDADGDVQSTAGGETEDPFA